jgi:hypothetical protein
MSKRVEEASKVFKKEYEPDPIILESLIELSKELPEKGKLQYAYLPEAVKGKTNDALRKIIGNDGVLNSLAAEYFALQHTLIEQYIDNPEKIDERYIDFVKRFYEPESGKYVSKRDITTLHNIILRNAAALKDNSKLLLHVDAGQNINLKASGQEIIITETLPTEQKKEFQNKQPEVPQSTSNGKIPIQKLLSNIDIAVDKVEKPEALPVTPEPFRLYDAADNLVSEQQPDLNGHAIFSGLSEGTYTVENSSSVNRVSQPNNYFVRYAAVAAVRLIAEELVALCDTVETSTTPRTNEKSRQRGRFNKHGKSDRKREDIQR